MRNFIVHITAFVLMLTTTVTSAQGDIQKANRYFNNFNYPKAVEYYHSALESYPKKKKHITQRLATSYRLMLDFKEAAKWYGKLVQLKKVKPVNYFFYAKMLESNGEYEAAKVWFEKFIEELPSDSRARKHEKYSLEEITKLLEKKDNYQIYPISINSAYDDFSPAVYGNKVVFVTNRDNNPMVKRDYVWDNQPFLDIYVCDQTGDGDLADPNPVDDLNSPHHEGPMTFTSDLKRIYFTRNYTTSNGKLVKGMNNTTNLKILTAQASVSEDGDEHWINIESLPFNSKDYVCQHPALTPDDKKLIFASDKPGGYGGMDLYVVERNLLGWSNPKNLGPEINTSGDEAFPYVSQSGDLYFASNGHLGLGGLDIFKANLVKKSYANVTNLGYPVNDSKDDFGLVINEANKVGYFSSNRDGGKGRDDIYRFIILDKKKEEKKKALEIHVYDQVSGEGLTDAVVNIFTQEGKLIEAIQMNDTGFYFAGRNQYEGELRFIASYPNYSTYREVVDIATLTGDRPRIDLPLNQDLGKVLNINPIYFNYDKANIRPDAAVELNKIVKIMMENPTMVIEVASHTDSRGNNAYNYNLAQRRARSSREYIIDRGISPERIYGQGYGEQQLTNECEDGVKCSESKHQLNRRTEFRIIKF